jgi:hypothetical protein
MKIQHSMKTISNQSILYSIPPNIESKQLQTLDCIRLTCELIDFNYSAFLNEVERITNYIATKESDKNIIPLFNYGWSIIDNVQRLIKLIKSFPSTTELNSLKLIEHIDKFRNTFQHMDKRIDECLFEQGMPFYGVITWETDRLSEHYSHKIYVKSGLSLFDGKFLYKALKYKKSTQDIERISLQTIVNMSSRKQPDFKLKRINFKTLIQQTRKVVVELEERLEKCGKENNIEFNHDWSTKRDILINSQF